MKKGLIYLILAFFALTVGVGCPSAKPVDDGEYDDTITQEAPDWAIGKWKYTMKVDIADEATGQPTGETLNEEVEIQLNKNSFKPFGFGVLEFGKSSEQESMSLDGDGEETYYLMAKAVKSTDSVFVISTYMCSTKDGEFEDLGPHYRFAKKQDGSIAYQHWTNTRNGKTVWSDEYALTKATDNTAEGA